jgi:hypothetical protein
MKTTHGRFRLLLAAAALALFAGALGLLPRSADQVPVPAPAPTPGAAPTTTTTTSTTPAPPPGMPHYSY